VYKQLLGFREKTAYLAAEYFISNDKARGGVDRSLAAFLSHGCCSCESRVVKIIGQRSREMTGDLVQTRKHVIAMVELQYRRCMLSESGCMSP
jgi:hypothetical protein